ncbi:MAG TPA: imidazoleglycerol-phosphate dehydratase HisB [Methanocorpusculum sp.]|nr:imidazoleglycerol-phosphate dehydratase HisB [Methanocorpusculum sp.]
MRSAILTRKTNETYIDLTLDIDGSGTADIKTGCGFLDHMLELFASHGRFDLGIACVGDTKVDYHHTTEDIGIVLGTAFKQALGDKRGIARYGSMILPMDEALILTAVDFSGRSSLNCSLKIPAQRVGDFDTELVEEFWQAFVRTAECSLHIRELAGYNSHHIIEGVFKSAARSIRAAVAYDAAYAGEVPSTKGSL